MAVTTFDTLKFTKRLEDAGIPREQAEAQAAAQVEAFSEALEAQLASKDDIERIERQLLIIKWMVALVLAVTVIPVLRDLLG